MKHEPLCPVAVCPHPSDPDFHRCWCGQGAVEHHHVASRGMGGSKARNVPGNIICLCRKHHEAVTIGGCGDAFLEVAGQGLVYRYWDVHNETIFEKPSRQSHRALLLAKILLAGGPPTNPKVSPENSLRRAWSYVRDCPWKNGYG